MKNISLVALMLVAMVVVAPLAQAQDSTDCISALMPCTDFLSSAVSQPTDGCCNPLKGALKNAFTCVCSIIGNPQFVQTMGYNINATASLPMRCGVDVDLVSECKARLTPPAPAPASPTTPSDPSTGPTTSSDTGAPIQSPDSAPGANSGTSAGSKTTLLSGIAVFGSFLMAATMMF